MVTIQHFVFVRSTSSLLLPFKWLCAKLKQAFFSHSICLSLEPPYPTTATSSSCLKKIKKLKKISYFLLLIPFCCFSHTLPNFFFSFGRPPHLPHHIQWVKCTHACARTYTRTSIQTRSCLLCTDKSSLLVRTQPGLLLHTFLLLSSCIRTHLCSITNTVHEWWQVASLVLKSNRPTQSFFRGIIDDSISAC